MTRNNAAFREKLRSPSFSTLVRLIWVIVAGLFLLLCILLFFRGCQPPVMILPPVITAEATSSAGAQVEIPATAYVRFDGVLQPTCEPPSRSVFALGNTPITCSAASRARITSQYRCHCGEKFSCAKNAAGQ